MVYLRRGDKFVPRAVEWAWDGYLARGKLQLIAGAPGIGKTSCALSIAATITREGTYPDGTVAVGGNVIVWSGEDDITDTLAPRLIAGGADMKRVHFVAGVSEEGKTVPFDPSRHLDGLRLMAAQVEGLALIIIDPVMSAVRGDSNKSSDVRRALLPLQALAEYTNAAVVGITHFTKGSQGKDPLERVTGSQAFGAVARIVFVAVRRSEEADQVFMRVKSNIGPTGGGFAYQLDVVPVPGHDGLAVSVVRWTGPVNGEARAVLHAAETFDEGGSRLGDAKGFLESLLSDGPMETGAIRRECDGAGHAWATIKRAQQELGIEARKELGKFGRWKWALSRNTSE